MESDVITVGPREDQEEVARYVARYDLLAVPVVDEDRRLLGIVTVDDVVDVIREEAAEDMLLMAGVQQPDVDLAHGTSLSLARVRAGWLLATTCGGVLADRVFHLYDETVPIAVLAGMVPVVMGIGGNVGIQSATLAVRGLATGTIQLSGAWSFALREVRVGVLLGFGYGALLGLYGLFTGWPDPLLGVTVGLSVVLGISFASLVGSILPMGLHRLGVDPAVATGPLVTSAIDVTSIFVYFNVARLFLGL